MKEVIDGKLYDTDEATQIATHNPVADRGDFNFLRESLYRTDSGQYYIAGEGGPNTSYRKRVGTGEYSGSSEIRPIDETEARRWCEQKGINADTIMEEFGDDIEPA